MTRATPALNALIAVRKTAQNEVHERITQLHRESQKMALLTGMARTYRKIRDEDPDQPGEQQRVQLTADRALADAAAQWTRLWDLTAAVDWTNCEARADVVVDGRVLIPKAPTTFLMFMEKQLDAVRKFVDAIPVLDPALSWRPDDNAGDGVWASEKITTVRTKKIPRNHEISPATDKHPAQVQVYQEDVPVGYWDLINFSGALDGGRKKALLARISALREAVKMAREQANMVDAVQPRPSNALLGWLLA
jgi:hypothetical protein